MAGIEAFDLVGSGNTLHLTAARALSVSGTGLFRVFGGGADRLVFDDTGWLRTGSSGGSDTLSNSAGNATVIASTGLVLSETGTVVNGGDGNDTLAGGNGADTIDGGNGNDLIGAYAGNDSIFGGNGSDSIDGGNGADTISGGIGNDRLQGGAGNDSLSGGDGHDTLNGGDPATGLDDTLAGGTGNDLYIAPEAVVFDTGGSDTVSMLGGGVATISASAGDLDGNPGIEAIDLAGSGRLLGLTRAAVIWVSDTDVLRVFGSGADRLVFEDTGWTPGASSGGFVTFTNGGATVIAAESLVSVVSGPTTGNDTLSGTSGADTIDLLAGSDSYLGLDGNDSILGNDGADTIYGGNGADSIAGGNGEDSLSGGDGNDTLSGDAGNDVAIYSDSRTAYRFSLDDGALIVSGPTGTDRLQGIESLRFGPDAPLEVASLGSMNLIEEMVTINRDGVTTAVLADRYSGPVSWLEYQMLGINGGDVMIGTSRNDFFNLLGGDDAANGGGGDDVLDGGSGSNFLTGGAGRDDFFLDGRGGTITWGTITDWQANERLSVWGWRPGVSTAQWVDSAGATGYTGVTMHGDLDGNGVIDTSMTWTGITAAQLPTPLEFEGLLWFT
jgi:Ca2+-binding RTX toxin-like protein